jgi:hypothetical protein
MRIQMPTFKLILIWLGFFVSIPVLVVESARMVGMLLPSENCGLDCGVFVPSISIVVFSFASALLICGMLAEKLRKSSRYCWLVLAAYSWFAYSRTLELIEANATLGQIAAGSFLLWILYLVLTASFALLFVFRRSVRVSKLK